MFIFGYVREYNSILIISKEKVTAAKTKFADVKLSKEDEKYVLIFEINILDGIKFRIFEVREFGEKLGEVSIKKNNNSKYNRIW
jgi:hypothetical protein